MSGVGGGAGYWIGSGGGGGGGLTIGTTTITGGGPGDVLFQDPTTGNLQASSNATLESNGSLSIAGNFYVNGGVSYIDTLGDGYFGGFVNAQLYLYTPEIVDGSLSECIGVNARNLFDQDGTVVGDWSPGGVFVASNNLQVNNYINNSLGDSIIDPTNLLLITPMGDNVMVDWSGSVYGGPALSTTRRALIKMASCFSTTAVTALVFLMAAGFTRMDLYLPVHRLIVLL